MGKLHLDVSVTHFLLVSVFLNQIGKLTTPSNLMQKRYVEFCEVNAPCTFYEYHQEDFECQMYKTDYRQTCNIFGGGNDDNLDHCIQRLGIDLDECDKFLIHERTYPETKVVKIA